MAVLAWDEVGERSYQAGIDKGVLYLRNGVSAVWNGLTSVEETSNTELKSFYFDGVKYMENVVPGDFAGKLKAYTYPNEFDQVMGIIDAAARTGAMPGLMYYDQPYQSFNLSYQTRIGNDMFGTEHGYKIHLLYNIVAVPDSVLFDTFGGSNIDPIEFGWSLSGTPDRIVGYRSTAHIAVDSTITDPSILRNIEEILYGTDEVDPRLPPIVEIASFFGIAAGLMIIDNGDGTWTAVDEYGGYISLLEDDAFLIDNADVVYLDPTMYTITDTNIRLFEEEE